jgi:hypothetical protein
MNNFGLLGGESLDFNGVAMREPAREALTERKICEGGCGEYFWRVPPVTAKCGEKMCAACKARFEKNSKTANMRRVDLIGGIRKFPTPKEAQESVN